MTTADQWVQAWPGASEQRRKLAVDMLKGVTGEDVHTAVRTEPYRSAKFMQRKYDASGTSFWRWSVPHIRIGNRVRYLESEVDAYMRSEAFQMRLQELREERAARAGKTSRKTAQSLNQ